MVVCHMIKMYGLKNCDTCKKAKKDLMQANKTFEIFDFKSDGLRKEKLLDWSAKLGWETLINKRGTTWRRLKDTEKSDLNINELINLVMLNPALIKRPLFELDDFVIVGYREEQKKALGI